MRKKCDEEFKKEIVLEYQKGASLNDIFTKYGVSKFTTNGCIINYSEDATL